MARDSEPIEDTARHGDSRIKFTGFHLDGDARGVVLVSHRWIDHAHRHVRPRPPDRHVADVRGRIDPAACSPFAARRQ